MKNATYNQIGIGYNDTRSADPYLTNRIVKLIDGRKGYNYLDIGCGTGNYTCALSEKGLNIMGIDPSDVMLKEAYKKGSNVIWVNGHAESLPFGENKFDGIIGTLTLHHWTDIGLAFVEMRRVLKPGGKLVFFTSTPEQTNGYWLKHYFPDIIRKSVEVLPKLEILEQAAKHVGLDILVTEKYEVREDLQDHFLFVGKHNPELYFEKHIRQGISSFSALANEKEVNQGLQMLRRDIDAGKFEEIKRRYDNNEGDYLFVVFGEPA